MEKLRYSQSFGNNGITDSQTFDSLVTHNRFLYRVHNASDGVDSEGFVVSRWFIGKLLDDSCTMPSNPSPLNDASRHLDWHSRHPSPFISASFNPFWAVWVASRRRHEHQRRYGNTGRGMHIFVIDALAVASHAKLAMEFMREPEFPFPKGKKGAFKRLARWPYEVLIYSYVPRKAILAKIPFDDDAVSQGGWAHRFIERVPDEQKDQSFKTHAKALLLPMFQEMVEKNVAVGEAVNLCLVWLSESNRLKSLSCLAGGEASQADMDRLASQRLDLSFEICMWMSDARNRRYPVRREKIREETRAEISRLGLETPKLVDELDVTTVATEDMDTTELASESQMDEMIVEEIMYMQ